MQDATTEKLIELLGPGHPDELRVAAARVLAEVGSRSPELHEALSRAMDDPIPAVRLQALTTLGQLRVDQALPKLLVRVNAGGPEAELAAQAVARLGARGTQALRGLMNQVAPGLRRRLAAALGEGGTPTAQTAAVDALLDKDPGVINAAVSSLTGKIPSLTPKERRALADRVLELLEQKKSEPRSPASESALIRLLVALADPRSEKAFRKRIGADRAPEIRAAALQALGTMALPRDKKSIHQLLHCACDRDFRVAAPALMILKNIPLAQAKTDDWLMLFEAPDPTVRRFAIEKLGDRKSPSIAEALLSQLEHPDPGLRDIAVSSLVKTNVGRDLLMKSLLESATAEGAWMLARILAKFASEYVPGFGKFFKRASQYVEVDDRRAEPFLFLLRQIDAKSLRDTLEERGLALRKKKRYEHAFHYFRLMARDPACSEDIRFELATCGLKLSEHDLAIESRTADPALQQFARLLRNYEIAPLARVKQAKWLGPEDLYYLGFHFIEGERQDREFGAEALRLAIKRSPQSKIAKDAKRKLRGAGLN
jgi:HEAT repeat protein